ncbi:hypothetical protein ACJ73_05892 [Blastomyces percursus]|uniref:Borealin N-terminal domain-containing protein n=1 Tax=Blastomyces percursus TaxID=1658174 RepID=A0A1J9Q2A6_9EURO|nr:hypothetical protein ACJ73_05892 [Blastomyces percursus]
MATVSRKRKSPEPGDHAPEHDDPAMAPRTPNGSPTRKRMRITLSQKQALIDNLQLEVTERARKLRAHYALQAQDLRGRIERRINRIPTALRKQTMGDLLAKYSQSTKAVDAGKKSSSTRASKSSSRAAAGGTTNLADGHYGASTRTTRGVKRTSDEMLSSDKENAPFQVQDDHHNHHTPVHVPLSNPKKRGTPNAHPAGHHPRVLSQFTETGVLSPKSSNSRTFPQSPLRNVTGKSQTQLGSSVRPSSPLKHTSPIKQAGVGNAKTRSARGTTGTTTSGTRKVSPNTNEGTGTRRRTTVKSTASTTSKRATAASATAPPSRPTTRQRNTRRNSGDSTISNLSSGTTIVKTMSRGGGVAGSHKGAGTRTVSAANKRPPVSRAGTKKTAAAAGAGAGSVVKKAQATEESGKRVLRKRV